MPTPRVIFHIDMNSYFASVAAQANPFLRGKAIGVGGKPGTRGIIAAASREAKARGVKGIMNAYEALRVCPELEIVYGDPDAYAHVTAQFLAIFRRYTDKVEVFSIDEAFLDVTGWHERHGGPEALAKKIKADLRREIGEIITCSIGIAPNKTLAKLASDMKKPDGLVWIHPEDVPIIFAFIEITDICGLAARMKRRLRDLGIHNLLELGATPLPRLTQALGPVMGAKLWLLGQGEDLSPVQTAESAPKSFGNSYTLPADTKNSSAVRKILVKLTEKAGFRMRAENFRARHVAAYVRYSDFSHAGAGLRLGEATADSVSLFEAAWKCAAPYVGFLPVRMVGVELSELMPENGQLTLWPELERSQRLTRALDKIRNRYGREAIGSATSTGIILKRHVSGFKYGTELLKKT